MTVAARSRPLGWCSRRPLRLLLGMAFLAFVLSSGSWYQAHAGTLTTTDAGDAFGSPATSSSRDTAGSGITLGSAITLGSEITLDSPVTPASLAASASPVASASLASADRGAAAQTAIARLWNEPLPITSSGAPEMGVQTRLIAQAAASAIGQRAPPLQV